MKSDACSDDGNVWTLQWCHNEHNGVPNPCVLIVYSDADQRKRQSSASLAFVREIHRRPVNSPHKWPVKRKMFPFDYVIMAPTDWELCWLPASPHVGTLEAWDRSYIGQISPKDICHIIFNPVYFAHSQTGSSSFLSLNETSDWQNVLSADESCQKNSIILKTFSEIWGKLTEMLNTLLTYVTELNSSKFAHLNHGI